MRNKNNKNVINMWDTWWCIMDIHFRPTWYKSINVVEQTTFARPIWNFAALSFTLKTHHNHAFVCVCVTLFLCSHVALFSQTGIQWFLIYIYFIIILITPSECRSMVLLFLLLFCHFVIFSTSQFFVLSCTFFQWIFAYWPEQIFEKCAENWMWSEHVIELCVNLSTFSLRICWHSLWKWFTRDRQSASIKMLKLEIRIQIGDQN